MLYEDTVAFPKPNQLFADWQERHAKLKTEAKKLHQLLVDQHNVPNDQSTLAKAARFYLRFAGREKTTENLAATWHRYSNKNN